MFRLYLRSLGMGRNQWPRMLLALVGMLIDALTVLAVPLLLRRAVEVMTAPGPDALARLGRLALFSLYLALVRAGGIYLEIYLQESVGNRIATRIRGELFQKMLRLPFSFFDRAQTGDVMSRLTKDVDAVRDGTGFVVLLTVINIVMFCGTVLAMFLLSVPLTLAVLTLVPLMVLVTVFYARAIQPVYAEIETRSGTLHTVAQENISGMRVVKAFVRADAEAAKFDRENEALLRANLRVAGLNSLINPCMDLFGALLALIVLGYGGYRAATGRMSLGTVLAFTSYVQFIYWPLRQTGWLADLISKTLAGAERIFALLDRAEQPVGGGETGWRARGRLEFQDVSFGYDGGVPLLERFNLSVAPGERVAIVGGTGAGKSTVAHLAARFYDPDAGAVFLDGRDLRDWPLGDLRRQIGLVFQDNFLFSLTVGENIRLGRPDAAQAEVGTAAEAAQIAATIAKLPKGYETIVGERGVGLSGGERQRIALARALLLDPALLILDDSTASLDAHTERAVQQALAREAAGKSMLIIAQRVATARHADRIVVLEAGRVVEEGDHRALVARGGVYAALYREQMSLVSLEDEEAEVNGIVAAHP